LGLNGWQERIMRIFGLALAASAAILTNGATFASSAADVCAAPPAALGHFQPAQEKTDLPSVPYVDENGKERTLSDGTDQGLVVNFWATWCAPCVTEMPALDMLAERGAKHGFRVVALSADREGTPIVRKFFAVNAIKNLQVALDKTSRVARAVGVSALPTTVLYDASGREVGRVVGVADWESPEVLQFLTVCLALGS
jgi:thiol-disulfide isomerase/thioredoxin